MNKIFEKPQISYVPKIDIPENMCQILNDIKIGQQIDNLIMHYTVIENTKKYLILRIEFVYLNLSRRIY